MASVPVSKPADTTKDPPSAPNVMYNVSLWHTVRVDHGPHPSCCEPKSCSRSAFSSTNQKQQQQTWCRVYLPHTKLHLSFHTIHLCESTDAEERGSRQSRQQQQGEQVHKGIIPPGPLGCKARAVRQAAGPKLAMPCMSLRVFVMLRIFLLMRVSALQPARLAKAKDRAQGSPLKKEDF